MLYRVLVNGEDILDYTNPELVLLSPHVEVELDVSGSFEFTIPPNHQYYDWFAAETIMTMTVEVWEGNILHFFGRPIELHLDFYKNKKIYCEGGLGFFNDSVIRSEEYDETALSTIFAAVISSHNAMVPENRRFTVGSFTVTDETVYRKFDYEQTSDALKNKFLDAVDGHFFVRREEGVNYIDFLKNMPYTCNQEVEFSENLLNLTYSFDGKDFATCVIPLGATDSSTGLPLDIKTVNNDSDILVGSTAGIYGNIVKVQHYGDIKDPTELVAEGRKYLNNLQWNALLIECSAADLHATDQTKQQFRVGQIVHCISQPHGIFLDLPISKMTLYLDSAAKQITLGRIPKKTLSRFYKNISSVEKEGEEPEDTWALVPPGTDGGAPTMKKIPVRIQITELPYITSYSDTDETQGNEYFDPTGIVVKAVASTKPDIVYFSDDRYADNPQNGLPMNELSFYYQSGGELIPLYNVLMGYKKITDIPQARIMAWVFWTCPYDNKKHGQAFYITNADQAAIDQANAPHHIKIETPPAQLEYFTGGYIHLSGAKIVAYTEGGDPYTASGLENGVIPHTELTLIPQRADIDQAAEGIIEEGSEEGISYPIKFITTDYFYIEWNDPNPQHIHYSARAFSQPVKLIWTRSKYQDTGKDSGIDCVAFSKEPFSSGGKVTTLNAGPADKNSIPLTGSSASRTYNGKTFYINWIGEGIVRGYDLVHTPDGEEYWYNADTAGTEDLAIKKIGYSILFGGAEENQQKITVSWDPIEVQGTLTDTFKIKVKKSEHGR